MLKSTADVDALLKDMRVKPGTIEALPIEPRTKYILVCDGRNIQDATGQRLIGYMKQKWGIDAVSVQIPAHPEGNIMLLKVEEEIGMRHLRNRIRWRNEP